MSRRSLRRISKSRILSGLLLSGVALLVAVVASAASAHRLEPSRASAAAAKSGGDVDVISAGSLQTLMMKLAPAFQAATGYKLVDTSGGSSTDAADIKDKVDVEDVFVSASPAVDTTLEGPRNGSWVSWYASFAASPEVLGYYPKGKFAEDLKTMPWYKVVTLPGFRLGRTNPTQDPGGVLAVKALEQTARAQHLPALKQLATETSDEYVEDAEQAGIQTGQLDASFMYEADANSQKSPFVKLTGTRLAGDYTITVVNHAPHPAAAAAFVKFLLGAKGQAAMKADHFEIVAPAKVSGTGLPAALAGVFKS